MEEFLKAISTPYWWISVAAVGIVINLVSAYLKPPLDKLLSGTVGYWKERTAKEKAEFHAEVGRLIGKPLDQVLYSIDVVAILGRSQLHSLKALVWLIAASALHMIPIPGLDVDRGFLVAFAGGMGVLDVIASMGATRTALRLRAICNRARAADMQTTGAP